MVDLHEQLKGQVKAAMMAATIKIKPPYSNPMFFNDNMPWIHARIDGYDVNVIMRIQPVITGDTAYKVGLTYIVDNKPLGTIELPFEESEDGIAYPELFRQETIDAILDLYS